MEKIRSDKTDQMKGRRREPRQILVITLAGRQSGQSSGWPDLEGGERQDEHQGRRDQSPTPGRLRPRLPTDSFKKAHEAMTATPTWVKKAI